MRQLLEEYLDHIITDAWPYIPIDKQDKKITTIKIVYLEDPDINIYTNSWPISDLPDIDENMANYICHELIDMTVREALDYIENINLNELKTLALLKGELNV